MLSFYVIDYNWYLYTFDNFCIHNVVSNVDVIILLLQLLLLLLSIMLLNNICTTSNAKKSFYFFFKTTHVCACVCLAVCMPANGCISVLINTRKAATAQTRTTTKSTEWACRICFFLCAFIFNTLRDLILRCILCILVHTNTYYKRLHTFISYKYI